MGYTVVDDLMEVKGTDCFLMMMAWEPSQQDRIGVSREAAFRIVNGGGKGPPEIRFSVPRSRLLR